MECQDCKQSDQMQNGDSAVTHQRQATFEARFFAAFLKHKPPGYEYRAFLSGYLLDSDAPL